MPSPTDAQIVKVQEVTGELGGEEGYEFIADLIAELSDGQWARALELITAWDAEYEPGAPSIMVKDTYQPTAAGVDIRSRMRLLLGLPEFRDVGITGAPRSTDVSTLWVF